MIRNNRFVKSAVSALLALLLTLFATVLLAACSEKVAGGNSSEVGSPELKGVLAFNDGRSADISRRASYARVFCVPVDYDPAREDSSSYYATTADSLGNFAFDSLPDGSYNLEAFFEDSLERSFALRESGISILSDSTKTVDLKMTQSGSIKVYLSDVEKPDGENSDVEESEAKISIVGSSYKSKSKILKDDFGLYATFADMPSAYYDSVRISTSGGTQSLKAVFVEAEKQETYYNDETVRTWDVVLNTASDGIDLHDTIEGFPLFVRLKDVDSLERMSLVKNIYGLRIYLEPASDWTTFKVVYGKDSVPAGLWVRLSTLYPQRELQKLTLSWRESAEGASDAAGAPGHTTSSAQIATPFCYADGFVAAWNFDEPEFPESTAFAAGDNAFDGDVNDITASEGIVGSAFYFNGKSSFIEIKESADYSGFALTDTSRFTASVWVYAEDTSTSRFIWGKSEAEYHFKYQAADHSRASWMFKELDESKPESWYESSVAAEPEVDYERWVHFTIVKSGDSTAIYRNGTLEDVLVDYNDTRDKRVDDGAFVIGARKQSNGKVDRVFKGSLDELYLMNRAQGADWARLIYLNQKPSGYWPK